MNIFKLFKSKTPELVAGLSRITQFDESSNRHTETPESCKAFGFQLGYNKALDFYKEHGIIPEPSASIVSLTHWKKYIEFGKVEGHNKAIADLVQKELSL